VLLGRAPGDPCGAAARVARTGGAVLAGCRPEPDGAVVVSVRVAPGGVASALGEALASARAGPAP